MADELEQLEQKLRYLQSLKLAQEASQAGAQPDVSMEESPAVANPLEALRILVNRGSEQAVDTAKPVGEASALPGGVDPLAPIHTIAGMTPENLSKRFWGALATLAPGGAVTKLLGAATTKSPADLATFLGIGKMGEMAGKAMNLPRLAQMSTPARAGIASGLGAGIFGAGQVGHDIAAGEEPQNPFSQSPGLAAFSALMPGVQEFAGRGLVMNSPVTKSQNFLRGLFGRVPEKSEIQSMNPAARMTAARGQLEQNIAKAEAQANAPARTLSTAKNDVSTNILKNQGTIRSKTATQQRLVGEVEKEILETKARMDSARQGIKNAGADPELVKYHQDALEAEKDNLLRLQKQRIDLMRGNLKAGENAGIQSAARNIDASKVRKAELQGEMQKAKDELRDHVNSNVVVDPNLKMLVHTQPSQPYGDNEFTKRLFSGPDVVKSFREYAQVNHPEALKSMRKSFIDSFVRAAHDPKSNTLANTAAAEKAFPRDVIAEVYGGGQGGQQAADRFYNFLDDMGRGRSLAGKALDRAATRAALTALPGYFVYHHWRTPAEAVAGGAGAILAVTWPNIVDKVLTNKRFGDAFHKWAVEGFHPQFLKANPALANFFRDNAQEINVKNQ